MAETDTKQEEVAKESGAEKAAETKANMKDFFKIFKFATAFDWFLIVASTLTSIGAGAAFPLMFIIFGRLVNDFNSYFIPGSGTTREQFQKALNNNSLYITYLFLGKFVLSYVSMFSVRVSGLRISAALRLAYLRALFAQPVSSIDTLSTGKFAMLIQTLAFVIGFYAVSFSFDWLLTFVASAALPAMLISYMITIPFALKNEKSAEAAREKASAISHEIFTSIRIVAAFGAEEKLAARYKEAVNEAGRFEKKNASVVAVLMASSFFFMFAVGSLTFWFGIRQITRGNSSVGDVVVVFFCILTAAMMIGRIFTPVISINKAAAAATEMFATIDAEVPNTSGLLPPDISSEKDIVLENITFAYPSRPDTQILDNLSVTFEAGKTTAIVGPSGCGKSTIVSLLERWYDLDKPTVNLDVVVDHLEPAAELATESVGVGTEENKPERKKVDITGVVKVGDFNISKIDARWWRSQIGLVQQEPFLFASTIYKNVEFGLCNTEWEHADRDTKTKLIMDACREAFASDFIEELPEKYETMVGEGGIKLSGGQRQRIAIARSIVKQPPILILDEATSALDVQSERIVQKALDQVSRNRTTIVIAHRLSTIKEADKIVVLRSGRALEEGSHAALLEKDDGFYKNLVHAQTLMMDKDTTEIEEDASVDDNAVEKAGDALTRSGTIDARSVHPDDQGYKERGVIMSFGRLMSEQGHLWPDYLLMVIGAMGAGAVYPLQAYVFAQLVRVFEFTGQRLIDRGNFWALMFLIIAIGVGISYFILGWFAVLTSSKVVSHYRKQYFYSIVYKPIPFFDREGSSPGTLTSRLTTDPTKLQQLMGAEMGMSLAGLFNLVGSIAISFVFGWKLSLVGTLVILPVIMLAGFIRVRLEMQFEEMNAAVFADSSQFATEAVGAFRTVISLNMEQPIIDRYQKLLKEHASTALKKALPYTLIFALSDSVDMACTALIFWYGGGLMASREYNQVQFFVIYMAIVQAGQAAGMWFSYAPNAAEAASAANRILNYRDGTTRHAPDQNDIQESSEGVAIEFKDATFTYETRKIPVISGLNLHIEPGQFAALVGPSGCGKSTIVSLIERFYDVDSGSIDCDNRNISSADISEHRATLSLVAQEPTLYEGTIRENVALSVPSDALATDARIHAACTDAQIHDFVSSLPDGYATQLGPKGLSLSGGQKQRLALARALLRRPRALLLDEATSSLDSESEKLVQAAVERAAGSGERTVLAVAHRLATIQNADVIFVLGPKGRLLEKGSHRELLKKRGVYYQMCQAQALDR